MWTALIQLCGEDALFFRDSRCGGPQAGQGCEVAVPPHFMDVHHSFLSHVRYRIAGDLLLGGDTWTAEDGSVVQH